MNYSYYGRRRYYRRNYSRSSRRAYGIISRSKRRATGNQVAARQQRDVSEVTLNIPIRLSCLNASVDVSPTEAVQDMINVGTYVLNIWDLLRKSEFYASYANMYDQVKINKCTVKITPYQFPIINQVLSQSLPYYNSYTIVTAWDRTGISLEQTRVRNINPDDPIIGTNNNSNGLYVTISGQDVSTYSSAITKNVNPNSNTTFSRTIYPSTISEKSFYANTSDLKKWYEAIDHETNRVYGIDNPKYISGETVPAYAVVEDNNANDVNVAKWPLHLVDSPALTKNPAYWVESSEVPFKPTLLIGMINEPFNASVNNDPQSEIEFVPRMSFNCEASIVCSFRGLRKAPVVVK